MRIILLLGWYCDYQIYINFINTFIWSKKSETVATIFFYSFSGGTGISFYLIIGTVNWGILEPAPVSNRRLKTKSRNSSDIYDDGVIEINLTIGKYGSWRTQLKPIVPRPDTVMLGLITLGISVKPYNPFFSAPLEYIAYWHFSFCSFEKTLGLSPPAKIYSDIEDNRAHSHFSGILNSISSSIHFVSLPIFS